MSGVNWDFAIEEVSVWSSLSAVEVLALESHLASSSPFGQDDQPQPWIELGGLITTDDGRVFSFYVQLLDDFLRRRKYVLHPERGHYEPLGRSVDAPDLFIAPWDEPTILVDAPYFDWSLIDSVLFGPSHIRRRILWPVQHTDDELNVLADLAAGYQEEDALRHALGELEARFGSPLRIQANEAAEAAKLLRDHTFLGGPAGLFRSHGACFSSKARRLIVEYWVDENPF